VLDGEAEGLPLEAGVGEDADVGLEVGAGIVPAGGAVPDPCAPGTEPGPALVSLVKKFAVMASSSCG